jgi:hypothetical protein
MVSLHFSEAVKPATEEKRSNTIFPLDAGGRSPAVCATLGGDVRGDGV